MKEFISYDEMKRLLFPTDIQSEIFVTADENIQDNSSFMESLFNDNIDNLSLDNISALSNIREQAVREMHILEESPESAESCEESWGNMQASDHVVNGSSSVHDEKSDEEYNNISPVYPLEDLYKENLAGNKHQKVSKQKQEYISLEENKHRQENIHNEESNPKQENIQQLQDGFKDEYTPQSENILQLEVDSHTEGNAHSESSRHLSINYAKARIFHAVSSSRRLNVSIGGRKSAEKLPFGKISNYIRIIDGYRTISVSDAETGILIAYDVLPFVAGSKITIIIYNTIAGTGISLVSDNMCQNKLMERSFFRAANFTFNGGPFDVMLGSMCSVFTDIRTKEITPFKQAAEGDYNLYIIDALYNLIPYNAPINGAVNTAEEKAEAAAPEPVIDLFVKMKKNVSYTFYIIGGFYPEMPLQVVTIEN